MRTSQIQPAVDAAVSTASALDLRVDDAVILHDSNRITLRLLPCDVLARVAHMEGQGGAEFEVEVARRLAKTDSPVASLDPRVERRVYVRDGFVITFWTYYEPVPPVTSHERNMRRRSSGCTLACGTSISLRPTSRIASRRRSGWSPAVPEPRIFGMLTASF